MIRRYKLSMVFKILLAHCSSSIVAADCSIPPSPFPQDSLCTESSVSMRKCFFRGARISEPNPPPVHLINRESSSVRRYSDGKEFFRAGDAQNGQSILGRKSHRGKQRHCRCRGQPIFPARKC